MEVFKVAGLDRGNIFFVKKRHEDLSHRGLPGPRVPDRHEDTAEAWDDRGRVRLEDVCHLSFPEGIMNILKEEAIFRVFLEDFATQFLCNFTKWKGHIKRNRRRHEIFFPMLMKEELLRLGVAMEGAVQEVRFPPDDVEESARGDGEVDLKLSPCRFHVRALPGAGDLIEFLLDAERKDFRILMHPMRSDPQKIIVGGLPEEEISEALRDDARYLVVI